MSEILMLHGNGGGKTRFKPFLTHIHKREMSLSVHVPELSGFDGRPLEKSNDYWGLFIKEMGSLIDPTKDWVLYGHGIGGSMILEWAYRDFILPDGSHFKPKKIVLHAIIGASLHKRFFPQLMKPLWIRHTMKGMISNPILRPLWVRRLFRDPSRIPSKILHRFFDDYAQSEAFSVFFDMIDVPWYNKVREKLSEEEFFFIWGERERIIKSKYLDLWKQDFPNSDFVVVPEWDHFPMLDEVEDFTEKMLNFLSHE
ncbi:MAG: alpha/beta hydrolase [Bacteroidia bacterium]|nr:alpha/beta hydrolase [Bacteroidia bacterium]